MNGKELCDKYFGMTEERSNIKRVVDKIFSEIDWLHPDYFGLNDVSCDTNFKFFEFTIPNYIYHNISDHNCKIQKILFDNNYVKSNEIKSGMIKINCINTLIYDNPLFTAMELLDNVIVHDFCKNGITITNFKGNNSVYPYYTIKISKDVMEKL